MTNRNLGLALVIVGFAVAAVARVESIRDTGMNAVLTGVYVILMGVGAYLILKAPKRAG